MTGGESAARGLEEARIAPELALAELRHRAANDLAVASAILRRRHRALADTAAAAALEDAASALDAVALIHRLLEPSADGSSIDLAAYLTQLCRQICDAYLTEGRITCVIRLEPVRLSAPRVRTVGLIVCELIRNAAKHAFGSDPGTIAIDLHSDPHGIRLMVTDGGCGMRPSTNGEKRQGLELVRALVRSLRGELELVSNGHGTSAALTFARE